MDALAFLIGDALALSECEPAMQLTFLEFTSLTRAVLELRVLEW